MTMAEDDLLDGVRAVNLSGPIRLNLQRMGLSQRQLAARLHLHDSVVHHWASGNRPVPIQRVGPIARVLGLSPEELLSDEMARRASRARDEASPAARLLCAGMVRRPDPRTLYELYCLNCGRGTGHDGVLRSTHVPPTLRGRRPCRFCGGFMLLREFIAAPVERMATDAVRADRLERNVA